MNRTKQLILLLLLATTAPGLAAQDTELARWEARAARVEIIRDNWGIPHVYAPTDADAVFGMMYAQCEDDFARVERNYLEATGQLALALGSAHIYHDLRARLWGDSTTAIGHYQQAPDDLRAWCDAFADGINYYLHTHPDVKPLWIRRFRPWMPFAFTEGSIGADITMVSLRDLAAFYDPTADIGYIEDIDPWAAADAVGSNGFALNKDKVTQGKALLLINPHTSFYFRTEQHVVSDEGLNVYGAATWGQFFIYQGFNEHCGWMHTSTYADATDNYLETVTQRGDRYYYRYGNEEREVTQRQVVIPYTEDGTVRERAFTVYATHHGPVVAQQGDKWVAFRMMDRPLDALLQDVGRMKAKDYKSFKKVMNYRTNSSNNTVFADHKGTIAYWHGNFVPKRNPTHDYDGYVDGSNPATDWGALHPLRDLVQLKNPKSRWLQNCNSTPFTAAGSASPVREKYARYLAPEPENARGVNAAYLLPLRPTYTLDSLIATAYDPYMRAFDYLIPALSLAAEENPASLGREQKAALQMLTSWDRKGSVTSIPAAVGVLWAEKLMQLARPRLTGNELAQVRMEEWMIAHTTPIEKLDLLATTIEEMKTNFESWQTPWGVINRFQRLSGEIGAPFDDLRPSLVVGYGPGRLGSLPSFGATAFPNTKRRYGTLGNSFVAVVSFGERVQAKALVSGGQSGDPRSPHFWDQAKDYTQGKFRDVHFYKSDVEAAAKRRYFLKGN
jgi:acyl-homoserine lactone acylase PvdQ